MQNQSGEQARILREDAYEKAARLVSAIGFLASHVQDHEASAALCLIEEEAVELRTLLRDQEEARRSMAEMIEREAPFD